LKLSRAEMVVPQPAKQDTPLSTGGALVIEETMREGR